MHVIRTLVLLIVAGASIAKPLARLAAGQRQCQPLARCGGGVDWSSSMIDPTIKLLLISSPKAGATLVARLMLAALNLTGAAVRFHDGVIRWLTRTESSSRPKAACPRQGTWPRARRGRGGSASPSCGIPSIAPSAPTSTRSSTGKLLERPFTNWTETRTRPLPSSQRRWTGEHVKKRATPRETATSCRRACQLRPGPCARAFYTCRLRCCRSPAAMRATRSRGCAATLCVSGESVACTCFRKTLSGY